MKKFATLSILAATLLFAGCSQQAPPESANSTPNAEPAANESKAPSDYPKSSIEVVIPFAPGGGTDTVGRILSNYVSKYLPNNQSVVIVNKPGGSGIIGLAEVQNAKPDGYKIGMTTEPPLSVQPHYGKAPYTHDSFQTIMRVTSIPLVLVVKKDAPWQTYEEWRDYVKQNPEKFH
jgi:tripartite-type tricarboxylate transporter receptor subunit TctC